MNGSGFAAHATFRHSADHPLEVIHGCRVQ